MEGGEQRERRRRVPGQQGEDWSAELLVGGLLAGLGLVLVWARRSGLGGGDSWGELPLALVLGVAVVLLLGLALREPERPPAAWRSGLYLFGALLLPIALLQLLAWFDSDPDVGLNLIWIFALAAGVALAGWARLGFRFSLFVAGVFATVSWIALWDQILDGLSRVQARWILLIAAGILLAAALWLSDSRSPRSEAGELLSAGGLAFVVATGVLSLSESLLNAVLLGQIVGAESALLWDALLLAGSVALIAVGIRGNPRGPAAIGGFGLLLFVLLAGAELGAPAAERDGSLLWWPLLLLAAGVALLAYSLEPGLREARRAQPGGAPGSAPTEPEPPRRRPPERPPAPEPPRRRPPERPAAEERPRWRPPDPPA